VTSTSDDDIKYPIVSTPNRSLGGLAVLCIVFGLLNQHLQHETGDWSHIAAGYAVCFIPAILIIPVLLLYRIVADETGISWRTFNGLSHANWSEVSDYYDDQVGSMSNAVVVARETKIRFGNDWRNASDLKTAITHHASNAKAKEWGFLWARDDDRGPEVFGYSEKKRYIWLWTLILGNAIILIYTAPNLYILFVKNVAVFHHIAPIMIAMFAVTNLVFAMPFVLFNGLVLPSYIGFAGRMKQMITVDDETITFFDGESTVIARWDEVSDYYFTSSPGQTIKRSDLGWIETANGPFCFQIGIDNYTRLVWIVRKYAMNAKQQVWRLEKSYTSLEPSQPLADQERGSKRYSYRNRMVRSLAAFVTIFPAMPLLQRLLGQPVPRVVLDGAIVVLVITGYIWAVFYRSAIIIDDDAITHIFPMGRRRIPWDEVTRINIRPLEAPLGISVQSERGRIAITGFETNVQDLGNEIERRSVNATIKRSER